MIALFARSNHPRGYGYGDGRAHGYVVVGFRCRNQVEMLRVVEHVRKFGIDLPDSLTGRSTVIEDQLKPLAPGNHHNRNIGYPGVVRWYSGGPGDWDYLFTVGGNKLVRLERGFFLVELGSRGDNRFCEVYEADQLLSTD